MLSSQRVDLEDALYAAGKDKLQVMNPLVLDGQKLIPSVTRVFSAAREMYVYLQAYESAATAEPVVAFVTFYRGRAKVFETPPARAVHKGHQLTPYPNRTAERGRRRWRTRENRGLA
ncbi:MAG: hypothetical protein ABSH37_15825 [Bryobacteraceae bacterium]